MPALWSDIFWLCCGAAVFGGFFRGFSGFGGVMAMTPIFVLLMPPPQAAITAILLDTAGAAPVLREAWRHAQRRTSVTMAVFASLAMIPGTWLLVSVDGEIMRKAFAATVIGAALLLLSPWRFKGRQNVATDIVAGGLSGFLAGATSMAGPPIILYLAALRLSAAAARATFILYSSFLVAAVLAVFISFGVLTWQVALFALLLLPTNIAGVYLGRWAFGFINDDGFRRFTLVFLIVVGASVLIFG